MTDLRRAAGVAIVALAATLVALPTPAARAADKPDINKQIEEAREQMKELQKKLDALIKMQKSKGGTETATSALPESVVKTLNWRSIGPATMGGRVTSISVYEKEPTTFFVATASGGLLKTENNGITFEHLFDKEDVVSIGSVCVAPSDKDVIYIGTGEANPRNSVSYGAGVYKSTDGGKSWKCVGLEESFQIGKVVVHPENPDVVYVGALGRLYGPNEERGLYKTTDGGESWEKIHYIDDKTGVIDMVMHPEEPDTLLFATYERKRDEFDSFSGVRPPAGVESYGPVVSHGKGTGLYKTTDGGKTIKKLTKGLPTCKMGRIGLCYYRKNPDVVFAIIDTEKHGTGTPRPPVYMGIVGEDAKGGGATLLRVTEGGPADKSGLEADDVVLEWAGKKVKGYEALIQDFLLKSKVGEKVKLKVRRGKETKEIEFTVGKRPESPTRRTRRRTTPSRPSMGVRVNVTADKVVITEALKGGAAVEAGLKKGDVIKSFDGKKVTKQADLVEAITKKKPGAEVEVVVARGDKVKKVKLKLKEARFTESGIAPRTSRRPYASSLGGQRPNIQGQQGKDSFETGGIFKSTDGGETWERVNSLNPRPMYFSVIRVDPTDEKRIYVCGVTQYLSTDGGKTFKNGPVRGVHADHHALWIDPNNPKHMLLGCDGGLYVSYDQGAHWDHHNHMAMGQFYHVCVDNRRPYRVYGGLQDNGSWGGPNRTLRGGGPINEDWIFVSGGDGFVCRTDPTDPDVVYSESQNGNIYRRNLKTGSRSFAGIRAPRGTASYRFNWNTPFQLSARNPRILYAVGNFVFKSIDQGRNWKKISPEVTRTKRGSGTAFAESPLNPDVLYAGTDDGGVWVTRDGGETWTDIRKKFNLPKPFWCNSIEASRYKAGRAYVVFDSHRSDDDKPYVFMTEDYGKTWKSIVNDLPEFGTSRVLREDLENENLLFLGTEMGCYASVDRGASWTKLNNNLPTVAVHEFALPTTADDLVVATHGRSVWVVDISALRQMTPALMKKDVALFEPADVIRWQLEPGRESPYSSSSRKFVGTNPSQVAKLCFMLKKNAKKVGLKVVDINGNTLRELKAPTKAGFNAVSWNLRQAATRRNRRPSVVSPGTYRVVLSVDGKEFSETLSVERDPNRPAVTVTPSELPGEGEDDEKDDWDY